jgi:EAL domain-containing protein (putative c-di-GMP-specific phosphodiesterase class I)
MKKEKNKFSFSEFNAGIECGTDIDSTTPARHTDATGQSSSVSELLSASNIADEKKLISFFQPIIGIASGSIIGYEALARQLDIDGRISSAGDIFSTPTIADEQLIDLDRIVRRQALKQFSQSN